LPRARSPPASPPRDRRARLRSPPGAGIAGFNSNQPVDYAADRIELQDKQKRVVLSGDVQITQGDLRLTAQRTTVAYTDTGGLRIQRIDATGGVVVTRGSERASGSAGVYDFNRKVIILSGGVALRRGGDTLNGGPADDRPQHRPLERRRRRRDGRAGRPRDRAVQRSGRTAAISFTEPPSTPAKPSPPRQAEVRKSRLRRLSKPLRRLRVIRVRKDLSPRSSLSDAAQHRRTRRLVTRSPFPAKAVAQCPTAATTTRTTTTPTARGRSAAS
jgi:lipopolysaccharide transport protein LptA